MLKYKTRKMKSPQGLPRVYFCCHKADFPLYFDAISDEILSYANCAIWFSDDIKVFDEEFMYDLSQMQLFIMPVTRRLLTENNDALDIEFKFAKENNIPVLPLMQETQLEELFNDRCGSIQFLDKSNMDITAISYSEKLERYLNSILIGDELAEKIRAAFDAYIFLSYRKKDRKYAQELIKLIHQNDFCRDIAVWYDEFLVPGENFNGAIEAALKKSQLFVMAVTPNLVNEVNYVMTTEYPLAQKAEKLILPAMVVPTDIEQLKKTYKDIPQCVNARYKIELSQALLDAVKRMALKENDKCPQHNFFIGLAYLSGVDVEVDHDRALRLIRSAAENGLKEAVEKLINMYTYEEGVKFNIKELVRWRKRLVFMLKSEYERDPDVYKLEDYLKAYFELGNACLLSTYCDLAKQYLEEMMHECKLLLDELEDDREWIIAYRFYALANATYGNATYDLGEFDEAEFYLEKSIKISDHILEAWDNEWVIRDKAIGYRLLSNLYILKNELSKAKECLVECTDLLEKLAEKNQDAQFEFDVAVNYTDISRLSRLIGEHDKTVEYAQKSIEAMEQLMDEYGKTPYFFLYINCFIFLAEGYRVWNEFDQALSYFYKALELIDEHKEMSGAEDYHLTAICKSRIATIFFARNEFEGSIDYALDAVQLYEEQLNGRVDILAGCDDSLMNLYIILYYYYNFRGDSKNAKVYLRKAYDCAQELLKLGIHACVPDVLRVYAFYIQEMSKENDVNKVIEVFEESITLIKKNNLDVDNYMTAISLYALYLNMGVVYLSSQGYEKESRECFEAAINAREVVARNAEQLLPTIPFSTLLNNIGLSYAESDRKLAKKYFLQAESAALENLALFPTLDEYNLLCLIYYNLSMYDTAIFSGKWERKFLKTAQMMQDAYPDNFIYTQTYAILRESGYVE